MRKNARHRAPSGRALTYRLAPVAAAASVALALQVNPADALATLVGDDGTQPSSSSPDGSLEAAGTDTVAMGETTAWARSGSSTSTATGLASERSTTVRVGARDRTTARTTYRYKTKVTGTSQKSGETSDPLSALLQQLASPTPSPTPSTSPTATPTAGPSPTATSSPTPSPSPTPTSPSLTILRSATFDSLASGPITPAGFQSQLGGTYNQTGPYDDTSVVAVSGRGKVIRTKFDAGTMKSIPSGNNGASMFLPLPKVVYNQACISYDVRFDSNFEWSLGGKLPGLEGVAPGVSPSMPTGGNYAGDLGWSARMMWLGPKAYSWAGPLNMGVSYMYHPLMTNTYGDNVRWNKAFVAGQWHTVKQCHVLNTPGAADGKLQMWFDGTQVVNNTAYTYRSRSDVGVSHLLWHLFRGGNTTDWASSRDGWIDIDNVVIAGN